MQETQVRSLVREDPTCHGATKPVYCHCWARALEPVLCTRGSHRNEKLVQRNQRVVPCVPQQEKALRTVTKPQNSWEKKKFIYIYIYIYIIILGFRLEKSEFIKHTWYILYISVICMSYICWYIQLEDTHIPTHRSNKCRVFLVCFFGQRGCYLHYLAQKFVCFRRESPEVDQPSSLPL